MTTLHDLAFGDDFLTLYQGTQFVQNETTSTDSGVGSVSVYAPLEHTPVLAGTTTATVYCQNTAIQTFVVSSGGTFTFQHIAHPTTYATNGSLNCDTGEITLQWNAPPGANYLVVSYEFNYEMSDADRRRCGVYRESRKESFNWAKEGF